MKPGRKLDYLIHEKVFGWPYGEDVSIPSYSTEMDHAWEVRTSFNFFYLFNSPHWMDGQWECALREDHAYPEIYSYGYSAPHAICLAALRAKGVNIENPKG